MIIRYYYTMNNGKVQIEFITIKHRLDSTYHSLSGVDIVNFALYLTVYD